MINSLVSRYGETALKTTVPCLLYSTCENCTTIPSCVFITTSSNGDYHNVRVIHHNGTVLESHSNKFCWSGTPFSAHVKSVNMGSTTLVMDDGWNDFLWIQCSVRGGFLLVLLVVPVVLVICLFCCCILCCLIVLCQLRTRGYKKVKSSEEK
eukprot:gene2891-4734_t